MICGIHFSSLWLTVKDGIAVVRTETGIDYEIKVPFAMPNPDINYLSIYHHIYDRGQMLYGFLEDRDRALFKNLISVQGVGCSVAIKLMSSYSSDKIRIDIADGDFEDLSKAKGIGKGTAKKIVEALKSKYSDYRSKGEVGRIDKVTTQKKDVDDKMRLVIELATKALIKLGFSRSEAEKRIKECWASTYLRTQAPDDPYLADTTVDMDQALQNLITKALKS